MGAQRRPRGARRARARPLGAAGRAGGRVARRLRLPAHLRGRSALRRPLLLARPAAQPAAAPPGAPRPGRARPLRAAPGEAAGVLVGHTHFDHAVDAPAIARRFGCPAYGSDSLAHLMGLHGLAERAVEVEPYRTYELGPVRGHLHAQPPLEAAPRAAVPYDGELTCEHLDGLSPAPTSAARSGASDRGRRDHASTTRAAPTSIDDAIGDAASTSSSPASPAAASPALLGADPAAARPGGGRPHPLRRLLPPARRGPGAGRRRELAELAGRDRRGQPDARLAALPRLAGSANRNFLIVKWL